MTTRLVHLSDLHFGRERPGLAGPLIEAVNAARADLVIVSGDLTQRARTRQFRAARAFLDRLEAPVLAVPGNHDTPLDNLLMRLFCPWLRFRRHVARDLEPVHAASDCVVAGLNTVDPRAWQRGRMRRAGVARLVGRLGAAGGDGLCIVVMHHPPDRPPGGKRPMRGAAAGIAGLAQGGADMVLCGHQHVWRAEPLRTEAGLLLVQAGTGLSTRERGEPNDLNVLDIDGLCVTIERHAAESAAEGFRPLSRHRFEKSAGRWRALA